MKPYKRFYHYASLFPALGLFAWLCHRFNFQQDDAYITYRYVANYLSGHGLVFNYGEFVEGITNHGWAVILAAAGALDIDYVSFAHILGWLCGIATIVITYELMRTILPKAKWYWHALAPLSAGVSPSFAYWTGAGLETAAFALCSTTILLLWLKGHRTLGAVLAIAVWLRPEGALLASMIIVVDWFRLRKLPAYALTHTVVAFVVSLPMVVFKLLYYGELLPNSFYAKTSFDFSQILRGLDYTWQFLSDYPLLGIALPVSIFFYRRYDLKMRSVTLFGALFFGYVIVVGGDVLKVHRFFLPLIPVLSVLLTIVTWQLSQRLGRNARVLVVVVAGTAMSVLGIYLPYDYVDAYHFAETGLKRKMTFLAENLKQTDTTNFSIAAPTIGVLGYELVGHTLIDLVGLTDTMVSRHPQDPIPGMTSSWREPKYNAEYILARSPEYILFSTGAKPTAPGEKALLLYPQFVNSYRIVTWEFSTEQVENAVMTGAFKKMRAYDGPYEPTYPLAYVDNYIDGINAMRGGRYDESIRLFGTALRESPRPYFPYLLHRCALAFGLKQDYQSAQKLLHSILEQDSFVVEAHAELYKHAVVNRDSLGIDIHRRWILHLAPWQESLLDRFDAMVESRKGTGGR